MKKALSEGHGVAQANKNEQNVISSNFKIKFLNKI